ncbi:hypothetical protein bcgnr5406_31140 [Bacillus cereus]|nr:hypothetical protein BC30102_0382 [Bacillus cereus]
MINIHNQYIYIIIPALIVLGLVAIINSTNLYINILLGTLMTIGSGILVSNVLQKRNN